MYTTKLHTCVHGYSYIVTSGVSPINCPGSGVYHNKRFHIKPNTLSTDMKYLYYF